MYDVRVNGALLDSIGSWGDLQVSWIWGGALLGGLGDVSWNMDVPPNFNHPLLQLGALVEVMDGALPVGRALLNRPGRTDTGLSFTATGIQRQAEHIFALDSSNNSTSIADTAIDTAISTWGWQVTRPSSLTSAPLKTADAMQGLNYLDTVLLAVADEFGWQVWVDGFGAVRMTPDVTTPKWQVIPGLVDLSVADDKFASVLLGRYIATGGAYTTAVAVDPIAAQWGTRMYATDMTSYGQIAASRATNRVNGLLAKGKAKPTFTDRLSVTGNELLTIDGAPASVSMVRAGDMVRFHGVDGDALMFNRRNYVDLILGEVTDPQDGQSITIAPVDVGATTLADAFAVTAADRSFKA